MSKESALAVATGTPLVTEAPQSVTNEAPKEQLQSTPFSQLAKKEAEIVRQRQEMKRDQEVFASEKEKLRKVKDQYDEYQATKAKDPIAALKLLGFSEADIFNFMADKAPAELSQEEKAAKAAEAAADARIKAFEEGQTKRIADEQRQADQSLIQGYRADVSKVIKANPDQFEYCNYFGSVADEQIYLTALELAKQGEAVSPKEIAEMVEDYYEQEDKAMSTIKKRNPVEAAAPETPAPTDRSRTVTPGFPGEPQPKPTITKTRTLHSGATATAASSRQIRNETREQKRERLMEALRNGARI